MIVKITEDNVIHGQPTEPQYCVLACAFVDAGFDRDEVHVDKYETVLRGVKYTNLDKMCEIIEEYDELEDYTANVEVPQHMLDEWLAAQDPEERLDTSDFYYTDEYAEYAQQLFQEELRVLAKKWDGIEIDVSQLEVVS